MTGCAAAAMAETQMSAAHCHVDRENIKKLS
jgi:hypothetical protein